MIYIPAISLLIFVVIVVAVMILRFHPILKIGIVVLSIIILREIAIIYTDQLGISPFSSYAVSTTAIGVITFFGFIWLGDKKGGQFALTKGGMRLAIVAAIVTVFLVLTSSVVFFTGTRDLSEISKVFIQQFNITVGTVLVFYFGASAYVQAQAKEDKDASKEDDENESLGS